MDLANSRIAVIGGAGLLGSHIVDQLLQEPVAEIVVFDNFMRGQLDSLAGALGDPRVRVIRGTMTDQEAVRDALTGIDGASQLASLWLGECLTDPRRPSEGNVIGMGDLLETSPDLKVRRR